MMKIKKFATYAAIGLLATSFVGCSREDSLDGEKIDFSRVENMSFSDNQAISTTLEEQFGISVSEEAAEFLDSDSVIKALQGDDMNSAEYQQLVANSYLYFSQCVKEDNLEYESSNLYVSYKNTPVVVEFDNEAYKCDSIISEYLTDVHSLQQGITSNEEDLSCKAEEVARDMVLLSSVDIEVKSTIIGTDEVFVKAKKVRVLV